VEDDAIDGDLLEGAIRKKDARQASSLPGGLPANAASPLRALNLMKSILAGKLKVVFISLSCLCKVCCRLIIHAASCDVRVICSDARGFFFSESVAVNLPLIRFASKVSAASGPAMAISPLCISLPAAKTRVQHDAIRIPLHYFRTSSYASGCVRVVNPGFRVNEPTHLRPAILFCSIR
jgi:hypothetical protein